MSCRSWTHDKAQIKQALESKKKHKDANKNQEYMTLYITIILSESYLRKNCGPFIINVLSFHMHLFDSAT